MLLLCGCVGVGQEIEVPEFREIQIDQLDQRPPEQVGPTLFLNQRKEIKTPDDVIARFGPPLLKSQEGESEVWSYKLAGRKSETTNSAWLAWGVMIPVWSTTKYDVNTKFYFRNSVLEKVMVLQSRSYTKGGRCGLGGCGYENDQPPPVPQTAP